jgi:hypothetical protein
VHSNILVHIAVLLCGCAASVNAQHIKAQHLASSSLYQSLYDVRLINDTTCYAVGEFGARVLIHINAQIHVQQYTDSPATTIVELLNTTSAVEPLVEKDSSRIQYAVYEFKGVVYSAYFKRDIIVPKKVIPRCKLYMQQQGKLNSRSYLGSCIWQFYEQDQELYCLKYNLLGTKLLCVSNRRKPSVHYKFLLHKSYVDKGTTLFCGAVNYKLRDGIVLQNNITYKLAQKGMVWDIARVGNTVIAAGSNGQIHYKGLTDTQFATLQTESLYHFYDIVVLNEHSCIMVGQHGEVYRVDVD